MTEATMVSHRFTTNFNHDDETIAFISIPLLLYHSGRAAERINRLPIPSTGHIPRLIPPAIILDTL